MYTKPTVKLGTGEEYEYPTKYVKASGNRFFVAQAMTQRGPIKVYRVYATFNGMYMGLSFKTIKDAKKFFEYMETLPFSGDYVQREYAYYYAPFVNHYENYVQ